jgi:hypothetical protein
MVGSCSTNEDKNSYRILFGNPEGKRLERSRRRWVDNIKMDLGERGRGGVYWVGLAQDRGMWRVLVNAVIDLLVP